MNKEQFRNSPGFDKATAWIANYLGFLAAIDALDFDPEALNLENAFQQEPTTGPIWTTIEEPDGAIRIVRAESPDSENLRSAANDKQPCPPGKPAR